MLWFTANDSFRCAVKLISFNIMTKNLALTSSMTQIRFWTQCEELFGSLWSIQLFFLLFTPWSDTFWSITFLRIQNPSRKSTKIAFSTVMYCNDSENNILPTKITNHAQIVLVKTFPFSLILPSFIQSWKICSSKGRKISNNLKLVVLRWTL